MSKINIRIPEFEYSGSTRCEIISDLTHIGFYIEAVIGVNASTGNIESVVQAFCARRVGYSQYAINIGYQAKVNFYLDRASGNYIFISPPEAPRRLLAVRCGADARPSVVV